MKRRKTGGGKSGGAKSGGAGARKSGGPGVAPRAGAMRGWSVVRCGDIAVVAWLDARRNNGWLVPWLPDEAMAAIQDAYDDDAKDQAPWQDMSAHWTIRGDDGDDVELVRHLKRLEGRAVPVTDSDPMDWCWEFVRPATAAERESRRVEG